MLPLLLVAGGTSLDRMGLSCLDLGEKAFEEEEQLLVCKIGEGADVIMTNLSRQSSIAERTLVEEEEEALVRAHN